MKCPVLISDEWFIEICWSSILFGISAIKKRVVFSQKSFGTLKCNWVIKTTEIFNYYL